VIFNLLGFLILFGVAGHDDLQWIHLPIVLGALIMAFYRTTTIDEK
jgi:hypothetical protein